MIKCVFISVFLTNTLSHTHAAGIFWKISLCNFYMYWKHLTVMEPSKDIPQKNRGVYLDAHMKLMCVCGSLSHCQQKTWLTQSRLFFFLKVSCDPGLQPRLRWWSSTGGSTSISPHSSNRQLMSAGWMVINITATCDLRSQDLVCWCVRGL